MVRQQIHRVQGRAGLVAVLAIVVAMGVLVTSCESDAYKLREMANSKNSKGALVVGLVTTLAHIAAAPPPAPTQPLTSFRTEPGGVSATSVSTRPRRVLYPFPHRPRPPMAVSGIVDGVVTLLLPKGSESDYGIRTLFGAFAGSRLEAAIDEVVAAHPDFLSRVPNGVHFDYGELYRDEAGNVLSGEAEVTCSDVNASVNQVTATCGVTYDGYTVNGSATQVDWLQWGIGLDLDLGGRLAGDVTVTGGTWPETTKPKPATVSGSAHFDTATCAAYPISGSIQVTIGGETTTVTFDDACDGSYLLDLPAPRYWALTMDLYGCAAGYSVEVSLVEENGVLTVDPGVAAWNRETFGTGRWTASGWINDSEVRITFSAPANPSHWNPNLTPGVSGTFFGRKHKVLNAYSGELTYTLIESPPSVAEACTVTRTQVVDGHNYLYSCRGTHCR